MAANLSDLILSKTRTQRDDSRAVLVVNVDEAIRALRNPLDFEFPSKHHRIENVQSVKNLLCRVIHTPII